MDQITLAELKELVEKTTGKGASFYIPTYRSGRETQQGAIRLKNQLARVADDLEKLGMGKSAIKDFLEPVEKLASDSLFWQEQGDGLAIFLDEKSMRTYRLPLSVPELSVVSDRFHIRPLLPLFTGNGRYFVLMISLKGFRVFQGTRFHLSEIPVKDAPPSLKETFDLDILERQFQFHTGTGRNAQGGKRAGLFFGHGSGEDDSKARIRNYFQMIDDRMKALPRHGDVPLILAGVDYLLPIYSEVNSYPLLLDEGIQGGMEELPLQVLKEKAWEIVEPHFLIEQENALAQFNRMAETEKEKTSTDLLEILPMADSGRVQTLLITLERQIWGVFDPGTMHAEIHDNYQPGDEDMMDLAASKTLMASGTVFALKEEEMPNQTSLAAIYRY